MYFELRYSVAYMTARDRAQKHQGLSPILHAQCLETPSRDTGGFVKFLVPHLDPQELLDSQFQLQKIFLNDLVPPNK